MNRSFKVFFSKARGTMVVASEAQTPSRKKGTKTLIAVAAAALIASASAVQAAEWTDAPSAESEGVLFLENSSVTQEELTANSQFVYTLNSSGTSPSGFYGVNSGDANVFDRTVWVTATDGVQSHALYASGQGVKLTNTGIVYITAGEDANSWSQKGMMAQNGATVVNNGTIVANNAYGMTTGSGDVANVIINNGDITVLTQGVGIELGGANGSQATNNGTITVGDIDGGNFGHGVLIKDQESAVFTNTGKIIAGEGATAIDVQKGSSTTSATINLNAGSEIDGTVSIGQNTSVVLNVSETTDTFVLKSASDDLTINLKDRANLTLEDGNAALIKEINITDAQLNASIWQSDNKISSVSVNEGGVFNVTKLNSKVNDADEENNRLLIAFNSNWTLNGGELQVAGETYTGRIKIGSANSGTTEEKKGLGSLAISAGNYTFETIEFGSAYGDSNPTETTDVNALTISGGSLTVTDTLDITYGSTTVSGGQLVVTGSIKALAGGSGTLTLNGGTLQTGSSNVFTVTNGNGVFFSKDTNDDFVDSTDEVSTNTSLTLSSGTLALTDEGYYTNASLQAMSGALRDSGVVLTILNAQGVLADGETSMGLVEGVVHNETAGISSKVTDSTASAALTTTTAGGTSLEVSYKPEDQTGVPTSVELTTSNENGSTIVLTGAGEGEDLVTVKNETTGDISGVSSVTVGGNVTLQLGSNGLNGETSGTIENLTIAENGGLDVQNMTASIDSLTLETNATVRVGNDNKRGVLDIEKLSMAEGSSIFLDPAVFGKVSDASLLGVSSLTDINGELVAGQNSVISLGTTAAEGASVIENLLSLNSLTWGEDGITSAIYVADKITLGNSAYVVADGSLTSSNYTSASGAGYSAGTLSVAANSLLAANQAAVSGDETLITGTVNLAEGSTLAIVNATEGEFNLATTVINEGEGASVITDNPFYEAQLSSGKVVTSQNNENGIASIASAGMQAMTRRADFTFSQTIADRASIEQELQPGINLWVDVSGENYKSDGMKYGAEFEADMFYGSFGGDVRIAQNYTVGAAFQYGTGSLRSGVNNIKNDVDNYGLAIYGTAKFGAFKVLGELSYIWGENDITASQSALNQSVDTDIYSVGVTGMYEVKAGAFSIIPSIGVRVSQLETDAMKVGNVKVEDQDQTLFQIPVALRINGADMAAGGWKLAPSFKIAYVPTFGDKEIKVRGVETDVIDTAPVQVDFGLRAGKENLMINAAFELGAGHEGTSSIGGRVGLKYAF